MKRVLITLVIIIGICLFALPLYSSSSPAADIKKFKRIVKDTSYKNYWERLKIIKRLGKIANLESTVILAELLGDKEPPIREATVNQLKNLTDKSSIDYLATTALFTPRDSMIRANTAWVLGLIHDEETFSYLVKALNDRDWSVRARAIWAISQLVKGASVADQIAKRLKDRAWQVRLSAVRALGVINLVRSKSPEATVPETSNGVNPEGVYEQLILRLSDSQDQVVCAALDVLTRINPEQVLESLVKFLGHKDYRIRIAAMENFFRLDPDSITDFHKVVSGFLDDPDWRVRSAVIKALANLKDRKTIELLIRQLGNEKWRLRYDIASQLAALTNKSLGFTASPWQSWYEANKNKLILSDPDNFKSPMSLSADETMATFFDIPIFGQNIVFVIDYSGSMKYTQEGTDQTKMDIALAELAKTLERFKQETRFNVVIMSTEALVMRKRKLALRCLPATKANKASALKFVKSLWDSLEDIRRGRGDLYDALMDALIEPDVDTIFLLSDGKPTYGAYIIDENIMTNLTKEHRFRQVVIHTILTGKKGTNPKLMKNIAELTGGMFSEK